MTECSAELADAGVTDLLSLDEVRISDEPWMISVDLKTLEWRLEREHGIQFVDWKISILDLLTKYLRKRSTNVENNEIKVFGTTSFYTYGKKPAKWLLVINFIPSLASLVLSLLVRGKTRRAKNLLSSFPTLNGNATVMDTMLIALKPIADS
mgnify:CR=1 FL=1